jgi:hypothetical protein
MPRCWSATLHVRGFSNGGRSGAYDLFFKFRKSKLLAEAPWELDIERDQALVLLSKQASIARQGTIHAAALLYHAEYERIEGSEHEKSGNTVIVI